MPLSRPESDISVTLYGIDRIIHEPARLAILAVLRSFESADFLFLLRQTGLTKGNLSSHLAKLETAGYITTTKEFVGKIPRTLVRLTKAGQEALAAYREKMEEVLPKL